MYSSRHFLVQVDPTGLEPGVHAAFINAYDSNQPDKVHSRYHSRFFVQVVLASQRSLIILVGLTTAWYSEKIVIFYTCIRGFMPNSHKKSWMISTQELHCMKSENCYTDRQHKLLYNQIYINLCSLIYANEFIVWIKIINIRSLWGTQIDRERSLHYAIL